MPRPLRIEFKGAWYHVMNRGANHQLIYKSNDHRNLFLSLLDEMTTRYRVEVHAFCLMDNHYHLLIRTPHPNLSKCMRFLDGLYTQKINRATGRDGPLFRGRYKAILIDANDYLLEVSRYIHLNPVAAKICLVPDEFAWSSYHSYSNVGCKISWLKTSFILNMMTGVDRRKAYLRFVAQGIDEKTQNFYEKEQLPSILGNKNFIEKHLKELNQQYVSAVRTDLNRTIVLPHPEIILKCVAEYFQTTCEELIESMQGKKNMARMIAMYLLRELGHLTHREISNYFGVAAVSISPIIGRCKNLFDEDKILQGHMEELRKLIALTC